MRGGGMWEQGTEKALEIQHLLNKRWQWEQHQDESHLRSTGESLSAPAKEITISEPEKGRMRNYCGHRKKRKKCIQLDSFMKVCVNLI